MGKAFQFISRFQPEESDIFLCVGMESLFFGSYLIYPPAAYILTGLLFLGLAYFTAEPKLPVTA